MTVDMSQFYQVFFEEAAEHLSTMETLLLDLDVNSPSLDDLNAIFRAAHSIKGGAGTFGFNDMTTVTHVLETLLDKLRKEELALRSEMIDAFLEAGDILKAQLEAHQNGGEVDESRISEACATLERLSSASGEPVEAQGTQEHVSASQEKTYQMEFILEAGPPQESLFADLASRGKFEIVESGIGQSPARWVARLSTSSSEADLRETLAFFVQADQLKLHEAGAQAAASDDSFGFFTDIPAPAPEAKAEEEGYGFFTEVSPTPDTKPAEDASYGFFQEIETPAPAKAQPMAEAPAASSKPARREAEKPAATPAAQSDATTIRVNTEKVDLLINLVGELVITQAMLAQSTSQLDPVMYERLLNGMGQLERNTRDLQESVMSIRMMPVSFVFSRFPRVVRDLANKLNKKIELKTMGEGTELDKGLIEKLADPLTHLVRNSIDHGIESPEARVAAGKDAKGTITLRAFHQGSNIIIEVQDNGGGLRRDKILNKAKERGLPVNDNMSDQEVWQLIFAPGFSTADVVTDVSGRGVGMDVVKRNIQEMGGQVEIHSETGHGTTISIRLPLTLAILDGMSIAVGGQIFIIPLTFISESLQPRPADIKTISGQGTVVHVRGAYLPLVALHQVFNIQDAITDCQQGILVLLEADGRKVALFVDELVGQHQVVLKSLEANYKKVPHVSGATIMGDGRVAMILDVASLVRIHQDVSKELQCA